MNKNQKSFLRNINKSIYQAFDMRDDLIKSMSIGVANEKGCEEVVELLNQFINAAQRTLFHIELAYDSENAEAIGTKLAGEHSSNPGLLN